MTLLFGTVFAMKGLWYATDTGSVVEILNAYGTFTSFLLGIIFAADVADKKLNPDDYE